MSAEDWKDVNFKDVYYLFESLKEEGYIYSAEILGIFLNQVELVRDKQIKESTKQVPALFKGKNE